MKRLEMKFRFFFGPDKIQFVPYENGTIESESGIPFHGIISRGLLNRMTKAKVDNGVWYKNAHKLGLPVSATEIKDGNLLILRKFANESKVLSFGQSALCAKLFIENYCNDLIIEQGAICEIWNIKEGHTSSVWKITFLLNSQNPREYQFIINVARDYEAGIELETTSERMKVIVEHCPDINIAKVLDTQKVRVNYNGIPFEVVVTKNEWIENSYEINSLSVKSDKREQYILVERFMTKEEHPSYITSIYGRRFSKEERVKIIKDIDSFLKKTSILRAGLNINEGDVVWNGKAAVVVAVNEG